MRKSISRTEMLRGRIRAGMHNGCIRLRFILGKRVKIGAVYSGYQVVERGSLSEGACEALYYDAVTRKLLLLSDRESYTITFLEKDLAVWRNTILADRGGASLQLGRQCISKLRELLDQHSCESEDAVALVVSALRNRFRRIPPCYFEAIGRMILYTQ